MIYSKQMKHLEAQRKNDQENAVLFTSCLTISYDINESFAS